LAPFGVRLDPEAVAIATGSILMTNTDPT